MGKLPYGVPTKHILASKGADTSISQFYTTENASHFGQRWSNFKPRPGRHAGATGYSANFRPGVYYSPNLDVIDNPAMGRLVRDNYHTVTERSYQPLSYPDGNEILPNNLVQVGSGFIRDGGTRPTEREMVDPFIDKRIASAPADVRPHNKPYLHTIVPKDPVELENGGYGPGYMSTENQERFLGLQPARADVSRKTVGGKEGSGFTHAHNVEPVTYHPDYAHKGNAPAWLTPRPTGISIHNTHFRPSERPKGDESLPRLALNSSHDTGFTSGTKVLPAFLHRVMSDAYPNTEDIPAARLAQIKKSDPVEYINTQHPNNYSSVTKNQFQGQQRPGKTESDRLEHTAVGLKELTGFVENNDRFVQTADNPARFYTHHMTKFVDYSPVGADREGHTWGGVQWRKPDGYTKNTAVHEFGPILNTTATIRRLDPYVGRSIVSRDRFADDHTHDAKLHMPVNSY